MFFLNKTRLSAKPPGFTLIELVVAISIVVVILSLVMVNFKSYEKVIVLNNDLEKLSSIFRQAQVWSLTGQRTGGNRPSYGVHVGVCVSPPCAVVLFADQNADLDYNLNSGEDIDGGNFTLSAYVEVDQIKLDDEVVSSLDIVYQPPAATIYLNGHATTYDVAEVRLVHSVSGTQNTISINRLSGQIDIQ